MAKEQVLIEATDIFAGNASDLLEAASFEPVRCWTKSLKIRKILHEIPISAASAKTEWIDDAVQQIWVEAKRTQSRYKNGRIVYCVPKMPDKKFIQVIAALSKIPAIKERFDLTNKVSAAVALIIQSPWMEESTPVQRQFVLDAVGGVEALGDDLRDDASGKLNAQKISDLFKISMPVIAQAAGISRQGLDYNPTSEKAQPVLKLFERVARLRMHPQFKEPSELRKWFRRPLPLFSGHSAEDLFKAGKLDLVATKVDQMLIGDFGG
jgi:hypothetical protein